ncbi:hypothetical protein [Solitalea canadensis]|uniref:Uncharacterized protein n=1 Tax=Solitalea canadensis (strain ATCC 29591 / DSM 3403 / JCM 21819 / LMG 8368 / NBRC 15130 / NCIMB 12057 / USAM 9D) TaxID=929556 RepID=H8KQ51_SOLCM|nr:hypothetical protein [Solitalea canadensis]AFD06219.1 hypothetical protein Solca_1113 [Solitalea canadensis DSM 3403]
MFTPRDISLYSVFSHAYMVKKGIGVANSTGNTSLRKEIVNKLPFFSANKDFNK